MKKFTKFILVMMAMAAGSMLTGCSALFGTDQEMKVDTTDKSLWDSPVVIEAIEFGNDYEPTGETVKFTLTMHANYINISDKLPTLGGYQLFVRSIGSITFDDLQVKTDSTAQSNYATFSGPNDKYILAIAGDASYTITINYNPAGTTTATILGKQLVM